MADLSNRTGRNSTAARPGYPARGQVSWMRLEAERLARRSNSQFAAMRWP